MPSTSPDGPRCLRPCLLPFLAWMLQTLQFGAVIRYHFPLAGFQAPALLLPLLPLTNKLEPFLFSEIGALIGALLPQIL